MKFGHDFKEALEKEGFPPEWVESAVPYSSLKKCIKKVERELKALGLDVETLQQLMNSSPDPQVLPLNSNSKDAPVAFQYSFKDKSFRPTLTLYIQVDSGLAIDATLSPDTRRYLSKVSTDHHKLPELSLPDGHFDDELPDLSTENGNQKGNIKKVEVPLTFDAEFFGLLQDDVAILDGLQAKEQKMLIDEITALGKEIAVISNPAAKAKKSDLETWRELFDIYLQAGVFFSTHEVGGGSRTSSQAAKQLTWFQSEVMKRNLVKSFKRSASRQALQRFTLINIKLLQNLKFQEINQLAISKILKKFDKRTSLGVKQTFPKVIQQDPFMSQTMAKAVCAGVNLEIVTIIPQLDDWSCPVCSDIAYKPIKLSCGHVFCIRCMITLQKNRTKRCPNCRNETVMDADSTNVDLLTMHFLEKYFPRETKAKQKENERLAAIDLYGEDFVKGPKCIVM